MEIKSEDMSTPIKYIVKIDADDVEKRKKQTYEKIKNEIQIPGFRKGNVPQDVAETHVGVEKLYRPMVDDIFREIMDIEKNIVGSYNFNFFGDLKKKNALTIEFIAELKPEIQLVSLEKIKKVQKIEETKITEEGFRSRIAAEVSLSENIVDSSKEFVENLDIAIIDFEGRLEGEKDAFPGGKANNYQICVNEVKNGKKQFIDNFEDQIVGMKINEVREVCVMFPNDYHNGGLSGKKAIFTVKLNAIKTKNVPQYDNEFVKSKGFETIKDFEEDLKKKISIENEKKDFEEFKKRVLASIINESKISPIPKSMIDRENEKEWNSLVRRMGKTEEELFKENKFSKESFMNNTTPRSIEILKTTLILEEVAKENNIVVSEDEVVQYTMKISNLYKHDVDREERLLKELLNNKYQYELMQTAIINEKAIEFLMNEEKV